MRDRIVIQNRTDSRDAFGQPVTGWEDSAEVWATVSAVSSRERMAAGAETAETEIRVWVRYRRDVTSASRFYVLTGAFAGDYLEVTAPPVPDAKRTRIEVPCAVGVKHA